MRRLLEDSNAKLVRRVTDLEDQLASKTLKIEAL